MSKYAMDKVIMALAHSEDSAPFEAFLQDPAAMLAAYDLTPEERQAFIERAMDKVYALGAQPYILSALVRKLAADDANSGRTGTAAQRYTELIAPMGRPDFGT